MTTPLCLLLLGALLWLCTGCFGIWTFVEVIVMVFCVFVLLVDACPATLVSFAAATVLLFSLAVFLFTFGFYPLWTMYFLDGYLSLTSQSCYLSGLSDGRIPSILFCSPDLWVTMFSILNVSLLRIFYSSGDPTQPKVSCVWTLVLCLAHVHKFVLWFLLCRFLLSLHTAPEAKIGCSEHFQRYFFGLC